MSNNDKPFNVEIGHKHIPTNVIWIGDLFDCSEPLAFYILFVLILPVNIFFSTLYGPVEETNYALWFGITSGIISVFWFMSLFHLCLLYRVGIVSFCISTLLIVGFFITVVVRNLILSNYDYLVVFVSLVLCIVALYFTGYLIIKFINGWKKYGYLFDKHNALYASYVVALFAVIMATFFMRYSYEPINSPQTDATNFSKELAEAYQERDYNLIDKSFKKYYTKYEDKDLSERVVFFGRFWRMIIKRN